MRKVLKILFSTIAVLGLAVIGLVIWFTPDLDKAAKASPAPRAPTFEFRHLRKGMTLVRAQSARVVTNCHEYEGQTTCDLADPNIAGVPAIGSGVYFNQNGVFSGFDVFIHHNHFGEVSNALTSAYGDACQFDVKRLHNAFNAQFMSMEATWCFDGGALSFVERSRDDMRSSTLSFGFNGPREEPRKFSPAEL